MFWKTPKPARDLSATEYLEALDSGVASSPEEERYLRMRAWHGWNDRFRHAPATADWFLDAPDAANLHALSSLLNESDPHQLLMKAEIARELGNFAGAETLLSKPTPPEFAEIVEQMRAWVTAGETRVWPFPRR